MRSALIWSLVATASCGFEVRGGGVGPDARDGGTEDGSGAADAAGDGPPPATFDVAHVPAGGQAVGTGALVVTEAIDTTALTIGGLTSLPTGVTFDSWPQPGGVELAVLHVGTLTVPSTATVTVTGSRALVVIASGAITIEGLVDGGAKLDTPGPGGALPDGGDGKGTAGVHVSNFRDSGGGGGGFGAAGGIGGHAFGCMPAAPQVAGGVAFGDPQLTILIGGAGGGTVNPSTCGHRPGGAGGGAIQLSSATRVTITGALTVGGGGGGGGRSPITTGCDMSAGSGGGAGGAVYLQSPIVEVSGRLSSNGGGGGSSAGDVEGDNTFPSAHGIDGANGGPGSSAAAPGPDVGVWSSAGGAGGALASVAGGGAHNNDCDGNGGGGGGSVGRLVVAIPVGGSASVVGDSPQAVQISY